MKTLQQPLCILISSIFKHFTYDFQLTSMCKQRGMKLAEGLASIRRNTMLLDELLAWLNSAEGTLTGLDQEPIPGDIQVIMDLLTDHQVRFGTAQVWANS